MTRRPSASALRHAVLFSVAILSVLSTACNSRPASNTSVIVLGIDGLDYRLTRRLMEEGRLPHLARLARVGSIAPLTTTIPPQSPVAWSTFITGLDPSHHGIFDFVHRDPDTLLPFLSTARTDPPRLTVGLGPWTLPLLSGRARLLREGRPFWEALEERGVPSTIIRMPANFPPSGVATRELSGMGTPDLLGTYGTFSYYTTFTFGQSEVAGGQIYPVEVVDNVVTGRLFGPENPFLKTKERVATDFKVFIDPDSPAAKIVTGTEERVIREGEWSDWVPIGLDLMPFRRLSGMCRFYLKQVRPIFELYVTPINIDPVSPAMPISTPPAYARGLAETTGRFYTQGMPEDTKAVVSGILSVDEFLAQARLALLENVAQFQQILEEFDEGLLFHYFGTVDQVSHIMWRAMDPGHPAYDPVSDGARADIVSQFYVEIDKIVGHAIEAMPRNVLLVVMSDHGFASWRRSFHLNAWLEQHGYLVLKDPARRNDSLFAAVDWSRTRAYGLGLNALYLNLQGREREGIVDTHAAEALLAEITARLRATIDSTSGASVVANLYRPNRVDPNLARSALVPDLILGYTKGTRSSNESALGAVPAEVLVNNMSAWSGDHCMDPPDVPGILITSRPLHAPATSLQELSGAILAELGIRDWPGAAGHAAARAFLRGLHAASH